MMRTRCFVVFFALTAPHFAIVAAQDQPTTSHKASSAPPATHIKGGVAIAATGEFNLPFGTDFAAEPGTENIIPRSKRWRVHWTTADLQDYTRQLDFFRIELAAADGGDKPLLEYVSNVRKPHPDSRKGAAKAEKRLYMTWQKKSGELVDFDKQIMARAGISTTNREVLQFYSAPLENMLAHIEKDHAEREGHKHVEEYRTTTFGVRQHGKGYEMYVKDQEFRPAPR